MSDAVMFLRDAWLEASGASRAEESYRDERLAMFDRHIARVKAEARREVLRSDESVERAARAFYENAYTAIHESIRPSWGRLVEVEHDTADRYRDHMRAALTAALAAGLGEDEDDG